MTLLSPPIELNASSENQTRRIFGIYTIFRILLSLILLVSFILAPENSVLGSTNPERFLATSSLYAIVNTLFFFVFFVWKTKAFSSWHYIAVIIFDILILTLISNTSGGVSSGMSHLLVVPIAAGSVIIPGIRSLFLAAIATIALIYSEVYLYITLQSTVPNNVQAGLLGFVLFGTAVVIQFLSKRIRANERVAQEQAMRIQTLTQINQQVFQRMNTGLLVINNDLDIVNANDSARRMLITSKGGGQNFELPDILIKQVSEWQKNTLTQLAPFRLGEKDSQIQAGFSYLNSQDDSLILIFLEDYSRLLGRAQQLKLVSLGRLTASIAHEIRNPLGAISHASQLLEESETLNNDDGRLIEIIQTHSQRVNTIIGNILELSRTGNIESELINVSTWLASFVKSFSNSSSEETFITIEEETPNQSIRFGPAQLEQVMTNLCDNGLRHSKKHSGQATLLIKVGSHADTQRPYFDIIDDGAGIDPSNTEKVFEPFFTTDSQGTGLGLYLSREICEAQQADIRHRVSDDNRCCFRISFSHPDRINR